MAKYTPEQLDDMEKMDEQVYASTRAMFEHLLILTIDETDMEKRQAKVATLVETYNNASEGCQRLMGKIRRLENG